MIPLGSESNVTSFRQFKKFLKKDLHSEQNRSRRGPRLRHLAERAAARRRVGGQKLRVIQRINGFGAQLQLDALPESGVLQNREIQIVGPVSPNSGEARAQRL